MKLIIFLFAVALGATYLVSRHERQLRERRHRNWLRIPVVDRYVEHNKLNRNGRNGIVCCYCGSHYVRQFGLDARHDNRRIHKCNHCNATLYRTYR